MTLFILSISTVITSIISAIIGMGGGILLLSVMTFFMPMSVIIPIHGLVQLISNFSRLIIQRKNILYRFTLYYLLGLPFGVLLAVYFLKFYLKDYHALVVVIILITYSIFKPKRMPQLKLNTYGWTMLGIATGILAIIAGAVGPLIAPFFIRDDLKKEEIIATKASLQMFAHFMKIPAFYYLDFNYSQYFPMIICLGIMAILGTKIGSLLLHKVNDLIFKRLYKFVLGLSGLKIIFELVK